MYSGVSGMKSNQTKMDVIGNNVANVGTTAYKKTAVRFSDTLYQDAIYASKPGNGIGGTNPGLVGLGSKVSGILTNTVQGNLQSTGRSSDLGIDGDGYFVVQTGINKTTGEPIVAYTRDGSFSLDINGNLVTSQGYYVLGTVLVEEDDGNNGIKYTLKENEPIKIPKDFPAFDEDGKPVMEKDADGNDVQVRLKVISYNFSTTGEVSYVLEDGTKAPGEKMIYDTETKDVSDYDPTATLGDNEIEVLRGQQTVRVAVFLNPEGLESLGGNLYDTTANSGEPLETDVYGAINQGTVEMSNVDLSEEFTEMIITTRAFQANSKVITTSDELLQEIVNLKR
jgi:flagellar hook protein FlgE